MPIAVGAVAPDFTLKDQNNQDVRLSDFRGKKNVLLVFYPFAFSGVCHGELCEIRDNIGDFVNDDAELLAVSVDAPYAHKAWATSRATSSGSCPTSGHTARSLGVRRVQRG